MQFTRIRVVSRPLLTQRCYNDSTSFAKWTDGCELASYASIVQILPWRNQKLNNNLKRYFFSTAAKDENLYEQNIVDTEDEKFVRLMIDSLPCQFLRRSDEKLYVDPSTKQRTDVPFDLNDGRPISNTKNTHKTHATHHEIKEMYRIHRVETYSSRNYDEGKHDSEVPSEYFHEIEWGDGHVSKYSTQWLRSQYLRLLALPPSIQEDSLHLYAKSYKSPIRRIPWSNLTEQAVRCPKTSPIISSFPSLMQGLSASTNRDEAVKKLYKYGLLLVTDTPTTDGGAGVAALASALSGGTIKSCPATSLLANYLNWVENGNANDGETDFNPQYKYLTDGPMSTQYGVIWSTRSSGQADGSSTADSAYGNDALPLHTDCTYSKEPPGLQIFTKIHSGAVDRGGGESTFADGLAVAERLREVDYEAFDTLCSVERRYRSVDEATGWYLEAVGPVIQAVDRWSSDRFSDNIASGYHGFHSSSPRWGPVLAIRHNDLDRLPDMPPPDICNDEQLVREFYERLERAHHVLDELLGSDEFRLVVDMKPGDTMVVANQRCLHGRHSFQTTVENPREIMGCYVRQDDLESRYQALVNGFNLY